MRTLVAGFQAEIDKKFTDPVYLIELQLNTMHYFSTRELVMFNSGAGENAYIPNKVGKLILRDTNLNVKIENGDRTVSTAALSGSLNYNQCNVWLYYNTYGVLRYTGEIDALEMSEDNSGSWISFRVTGRAFLAQMWPNIRTSPEVGFNHLPAPGTSFVYGSNNYVLESAR